MIKISKNKISVNIPSSFVKKNNKMREDKGSGEAKLFIANKRDIEEINSFFNDFSKDNEYYFKKSDVIDYLKNMFLEYKYNIFQQYQKINEEVYRDNVKKLEGYKDKRISLKLEDYTDKTRIYVRSKKETENDWNFITREIPLPKITQIIFEKLGDKTYYLKFSINVNNKTNSISSNNGDIVLNKIYYGAPGTGKSYKINNIIRDNYSNYDPSKGNDYVFRITLHPEYTYSDFVGQLVPHNDGDTIKYEFLPGVFTLALKKAIENSNKIIYLVLEEMSRSNVAAIFGDIFQLLDRKNGMSEYAINNPDIAQQVYGDSEHKIAIPSNMIILGTVNTNDQNVFVMDTAFKRRFNWQYISTYDGADNDYFIKENNPEIDIDDGRTVSWKDLYQALNRFIVGELGLSEDKQIGPFFIKFEGKKGEEAHNLVKDKLLQYLWQDVNTSTNSIYSTNITLFDKNIVSFFDLYHRFSENKKIFSDEFLKKLGDVSDSEKFKD